jgi:death-on-curing protein
MTKYLSLEEILRLHFQLIEDYGGSHGVRDEARIKSVVDAPRQEVFGTEQYETVYKKAAVYIRNIIGDHPFVDGNKRSGITVAGVFLLRNGMKLTVTPKELEDFAVAVAVEHLDVPAIAAWLQQHAASKT